MAIESPQAVKFSNEKIRIAADKLSQLNYLANEIIDDWFASGMDKSITNTADIILDGSENDGRTIITGADAVNIITRLIEFRDDMAAGDKAKLNTVLKPAVNTTG